MRSSPAADRQPPAPRDRAGGADGDQGKAQGQGRDRLAEVARGGALNIVGAVISGVATLGVTLLVTHRFSRAAAGAFFTATSAFLVVQAVTSLGAGTGLVYFIARLRSLRAATRIPAILRAAVIPVAVASLAGTAVLWGFATPLAHILLRDRQGENAVTTPEVAAALRALALMMPFAGLLDALLGATRGYRAMRPTVAIDRIGRQLGQVTGVLVAGLLGSTALLMPLWALPYVPAAGVAWLWLRRIRRAPAPAPRTPDWDSLPPGLVVLMSLSRPVTRADAGSGTGRPAGGGQGRNDHPFGARRMQRALATATPAGFWRFTTPRAIANLIGMLLQRLDIVLVAIIKGPTWAAVYTAASGFLFAGQLGSMAIMWAAQPRFTELFTIRDLRGANLIYQVTTAWLVLLTWPIYLLTIVDGRQALAIFGQSYRAGSTVLIILGFSMLLSAACGQVGMVLITSGRSSWSLGNGLLQVIVNVGLDLWLIPRYGITGAAIGWAAAIALGNLLPLAQLAGVLGLHPFGRGTLIAIVLSTASFGAVPLAVRAVLGGGPVPFAAGIAGGCLLLLAGLWRFRAALRLSSLPGASAVSARLLRVIART